MENLGRNGPSFYKIMLFEFVEKLRIPNAFVAEHGECLMKKVYELETSLSEKIWKVKIEEKDGHYSFTKGWPKFVKDCGLEFGNVLIFRFINGSRIQVKIFERSGCEQEALTATEESEENIDDDDDDESGDLAKTKERKSYTFTWKIYMKNSMSIKGSFAKKMELTKVKEVKMRNLRGDVYAVKLYHFANGRSGFGSGWSAFVDASDFILDKVYKFEFKRNEKGEILVQMSQELA